MSALARIIGTLSLAVFVAGVAVYVASFVPGSGVSRMRVDAVPLGALAAFIAAGVHSAIFKGRSGYTTEEFENLMVRLVPRWAGCAFIALFLLMFVNTVYGAAVYEGRPEVRDGKFVLTSHGKVVGQLADEEEYHAAERAEVRGMSGTSMPFSAISTLYFLILYPRTRAALAAGAGG